MLRPYDQVVALARRQDDVVTRRQARQLGMSEGAITIRRRRHGWASPIHGALLVPPVRDELRAHARAAQAVVGGTICGRTAARLHGLPGLPLWRPGEAVDIALPHTRGTHQRRDCRRHAMPISGPEIIDLSGLWTTAVPRTIEDLALLYDRELFICVIDALIQQRRLTRAGAVDLRGRVAGRRGGDRADRWWAQIDGRAESPLETLVRLALCDAGLPPEELQWVVREPSTGRPIARLDLAWPSLLVAVEADGVGPHGEPEALHRDRARQNGLVRLGWDVLRFTWRDATAGAAGLAATVRAALDRARAAAWRAGGPAGT